VKRSSRPPRPFRFWKGIFNFPGGEPAYDDGHAFRGEPMGSVDDVQRTLARHFGPLVGGSAEVAGVPVELQLVARDRESVSQIEVHVVATDEGLPTAVALKLAALTAEQGWTVIDWN